MRYGQVSLAAAMTPVKLPASLGASLVWISGGSSLVQSLIKETLPSWFLLVHGLRQEGGESGGMVAMLGGYKAGILCCALWYICLGSGLIIAKTWIILLLIMILLPRNGIVNEWGFA